MIGLSIIIVNWNTRGLLRHCLRDVCDATQGLCSEIVLVDNASTDGSVEMILSEFPQVQLIQNRENVGFARANNQAICASLGRYVLLLNSDAFITEGAIRSLIEVMEADPEVGIAGARLLFPDGRPQFSHGPLPTIPWEIMTQFGLDKLRPAKDPDPSKPFVETGRVVGACMLARRTMLDQIGLFDEDFFFFSEEVDLCQRAHEAGWKVVHVPGAKVVHIGGASSGINSKRTLMLYHEKLHYFSKHRGRGARLLILLGMWIGTLVKLVTYWGLRVLTRGRVQKDNLWRRVARGLRQISA